MDPRVQAIIAAMELAPLPREGGFFRPIHVSEARGPGGRPVESAIWYLLTTEHFSALHRLQAREHWRFCEGDPVEHGQLDPRDGTLRVSVLAARGAVGSTPEVVVPPGVWQGARLVPQRRRYGLALLTCVVTPAWDEREFELGRRDEMGAAFPAAAAWIRALTR